MTGGWSLVTPFAPSALFPVLFTRDVKPADADTGARSVSEGTSEMQLRRDGASLRSSIRVAGHSAPQGSEGEEFGVSLRHSRRTFSFVAFFSGWKADAPVQPASCDHHLSSSEEPAPHWRQKHVITSERERRLYEEDRS